MYDPVHYGAGRPITCASLHAITAVSGLRQGLRFLQLLSAVLASDTLECPRCGVHGHVRRKHSLQWTLALLMNINLALYPAI